MVKHGLKPTNANKNSERKFANMRTSVAKQDKTTSLLNPWNEIIN